MSISKKHIITFLVIILVLLLCFTIYLLIFQPQILHNVEYFEIPSWVTDKGYTGSKELNLDPKANYSPNAYCRGVGNSGITLNGVYLNNKAVSSR